MLFHAAILFALLSIEIERIPKVNVIEVVMIDENSSIFKGGQQGGVPRQSVGRGASTKAKDVHCVGTDGSQVVPVNPNENPSLTPVQGISRNETLPGMKVKDTDGLSEDGVTVAAKGSGGLKGGDGATHGGSSWGGGGTGSGKGAGSGTGYSSGIGEAGFGSPAGPRFLHREMPEYPHVAKRRKKEGKVVLMLTIDEHGRLLNIEVVEASDPLFVGPSVDAVKKSTFFPAMRNGAPIAVRVMLPIRFSLKDL